MKFGFPSFPNPFKPDSPSTEAVALPGNTSSPDTSKGARTSIPGDASKGDRLRKLVSSRSDASATKPKLALREGGPVRAQGFVTILPGMATPACNALVLAGWEKDMLPDLSADITTMLEAIEGKDSKEKKALNKAFKNKYQAVLKPVNFLDSKVPSVMKPLRDALNIRVASMNSTAEPEFQVSSISDPFVTDLAPDTGPGFDAERTNAAFERIHEKYSEKWGAIFAAERQASGETALDVDKPDALIKFEAAPSTDPASENQTSANEARKEMKGPNTKLRNWLKENNIHVARNSGMGNNCLIISLLQHATGNYDASNFQAAAKYRRLVSGNHMLHSNDEDFKRIVDAINTDYGVDMNALSIQADEAGVPFLEGDLDTGNNKVVIWNQGAHYVALVSEN